MCKTKDNLALIVKSPNDQSELPVNHNKYDPNFSPYHILKQESKTTKYKALKTKRLTGKAIKYIPMRHKKH